MSDYRELLLGCGFRRDKVLATPDHIEWENLTTLDINPNCKPDVLWDLRDINPMPFDANCFDEVHAIEVLEHIGCQGDAWTLFWQFRDYWRVLKPGGFFCATVPSWKSVWAWGDPGHIRVINEGTLVFLSHVEYEKQQGVSPMSDYRALLGEANFERVFADYRGESFVFVLRAVKG